MREIHVKKPAEKPKAPERNDLFASFTSFLKYTIQPPKAVQRPASKERPMAYQLYKDEMSLHDIRID